MSAGRPRSIHVEQFPYALRWLRSRIRHAADTFVTDAGDVRAALHAVATPADLIAFGEQFVTQQGWRSLRLYLSRRTQYDDEKNDYGEELAKRIDELRSKAARLAREFDPLERDKIAALADATDDLLRAQNWIDEKPGRGHARRVVRSTKRD